MDCLRLDLLELFATLVVVSAGAAAREQCAVPGVRSWRRHRGLGPHAGGFCAAERVFVSGAVQTRIDDGEFGLVTHSRARRRRSMPTANAQSVESPNERTLTHPWRMLIGGRLVEATSKATF